MVENRHADSCLHSVPNGIRTPHDNAVPSAGWRHGRRHLPTHFESAAGYGSTGLQRPLNSRYRTQPTAVAATTPNAVEIAGFFTACPM